MSSHTLRDGLLFGQGSDIPADFIAYGILATQNAGNDMHVDTSHGLLVRHQLSTDSTTTNRKGVGRAQVEADATAAAVIAAAGAGNGRYDLVVVDTTSGVASIVTGTEATLGAEVPPAVPAGKIQAAKIGPIVVGTIAIGVLIDNSKRTIGL